MATEPSVVAPGNHDGVHLGHRALLEAARRRTGDALRMVALFFDPHPSAVLAPDRAPPLLTTAGRREALLREAGADEVVAQRFDRAFASLSPEAFVTRVLVDGLGARGVVVGPDFRFGHGRVGDLGVLRRLGETHGFDVTVVEPVVHRGVRVSSTRVREHLARGDVTGAAELLDRVHDVTGTVIEGDRRGRTIGFPTANLECEPVMLPADGVYAVLARIVGGDDRVLSGVANLGVRPTVEAGRSVEVHLFDFDDDVYGARLRVGFVERIRGEVRFDGLDALKKQIARDAEAARGAVEAVERRRIRCL